MQQCAKENDMTIRLCGKCGNVMRDDDAYCPRCGCKTDDEYEKEATVFVPFGVTKINIEQSDEKTGVYVKAAPSVPEDVYIKVLKYAAHEKKISTSWVQTKFYLGYSKASRIINWMEQKGYISPACGAQPRDVLISPEDVEKLYG